MQPPFQFPNFDTVYANSDWQGFKRFKRKLIFNVRRFFVRSSIKTACKFLTQHAYWQPLFKKDPAPIEALLQIYCDQRFSAKQRVSKVITTLEQAQKTWGLPFCQHLLAHPRQCLVKLTPDIGLYLNINPIDVREGFFSFNLASPTGKSYYDLSFCFLSDHEILMASIQGPSDEHAQETVKQVTKQLHGMRPMFMLVYAVQQMAYLVNNTVLGIPHKAQAKYRWNDSHRLLFNYDKFWQENNAQYDQSYWVLPKQAKRRPLEEISSKKRAMYRRRYEMLDLIDQAFATYFKHPV